ncbi:MAG: NAD-dependent epimerase/dehydratase family protein [Bacteroides sp.]|nr:NAD-dependent epimerase/dehydratase family protein [Bacteroides sp.]
MKILVTGTAGFIGMHLVHALTSQGHEVVGLDNINDYYDVQLKYDRLRETGIDVGAIVPGKIIASTRYPAYRFVQMDLCDKQALTRLFEAEQFDGVVNLAAQAGVRYSTENPEAYVASNVMGFLHLLECCRHYPVKHLVYASSSSVYGLNEKTPFSEDDRTDAPASLYAATKKADEMMAYAYSNLYQIPATGVRFFTVYGPWGRPDMAPFLFMKAIRDNQPIRVFNHGKLKRDFTYIDDIVNGLVCILAAPPSGNVKHTLYNIGNSRPVELMDFIAEIESVTGKVTDKQMMDMQPGDVYHTYADTRRLQHDFGYTPLISISEGIRRFHEWYVGYFG